MFRPKLFDTLKDYNRQQIGKDLMAGLIVGIVALPLAIAFAIAFTFVRLRLRDKRPPASNFISITDLQNKDRIERTRS